MMRGGPMLIRGAAFLAVVLVGVLIGVQVILSGRRLPVYGPRQLDPRLVDPAVRNAAGEHRIGDFRLVDQTGDTLTLADTKGRIIVADFFFTTCGTICPKMTSQMERVQAAYLDDPRVTILSHSVTPEVDNVEVLRDYAALHGADPRRWHMLTGDRPQIYALARRSYFAAMDEGDGGPDDFVHTENFVLVDTLRRIRGYYDGTSSADVDRLIDDIDRLLREAPAD
jgi:protein SCO1/2